MSNKTKKQLSRRHFLAIGGAVAGTAAIAGVSYSLLNPTNQAQGGLEPERLVSKNGALNISLVAAMTSKVINGKTAKVMTYNGTSPGPTWVAKPGDVITVDFTNNLGDSHTSSRSLKITKREPFGTTHTTMEWPHLRFSLDSTGGSSSRMMRPPR